MSRSHAIPEHLAPKQGELIMFENNALLERLSRMRYTTVLIVYLPVIAFAVYLCLEKGTGIAATAGLFLGGVVFWTFFEYFFHRFVFHFNATTPFQHKILFTIHGVHHQYPNDKDRLVMPITVSIPLAALFGLLFSFIAIKRSALYKSWYIRGVFEQALHYGTSVEKMFKGEWPAEQAPVRKPRARAKTSTSKTSKTKATKKKAA